MIKLTESNKTLLTFFAYAIHLSEFIEDKWLRHISNQQQIKNLSNNLNHHLQKAVTQLQIDSKMTDEEVEQFINAAHVMEHLFGVGLKIDTMENEVQKQTLITQLNILFHSYGLPKLELLVRSGASVANKNSDDGQTSAGSTGSVDKSPPV